MWEDPTPPWVVQILGRWSGSCKKANQTNPWGNLVMVSISGSCIGSPQQNVREITPFLPKLLWVSVKET